MSYLVLQKLPKKHLLCPCAFATSQRPTRLSSHKRAWRSSQWIMHRNTAAVFDPYRYLASLTHRDQHRHNKGTIQCRIQADCSSTPQSDRTAIRNIFRCPALVLRTTASTLSCTAVFADRTGIVSRPRGPNKSVCIVPVLWLLTLLDRSGCPNARVVYAYGVV